MIFDYDLVAKKNVVHVYRHKKHGFYRVCRQDDGQVESIDGKIISRASDDGIEYVSEKLPEKDAIQFVKNYCGIEIHAAAQ